MLFALIYFCNQGMLHKDSEADNFQNQNKLSVKQNRKKWKKLYIFEKQDGKL